MRSSIPSTPTVLEAVHSLEAGSAHREHRRCSLTHPGGVLPVYSLSRLASAQTQFAWRRLGCGLGAL